MQQLFNTRNYSVRDFEEWREKGELVLAPKFQRREVWNPKARSYLIDTILRGKPIPKIYMRQDINPTTRRANREIVDGQQRLHTVLSFIKDAFKVSKAHNEEFGGKFFSDLDVDTQRDILKYEFVVDLLQDMPDNEVYDLFARINTYSERLKDQELRNAKWFGEFKSSVYQLAKDFSTFFATNNIFSAKQILRMAEAEFISELLIAMHEGIRGKAKSVIDTAYKKYDDSFPKRRRHEKRFRQTMDIIAEILGPALPQLDFASPRMFYPLFCAIYHLKFRLRKLTAPRKPFRAADYPRLKMALEEIDDLIERIKDSEAEHEEISLSSEERRFYNAYKEHWVHSDERAVLTTYIGKRLIVALNGE